MLSYNESIMRKIKTQIKAEARERKKRKRMHMSGAGLRKAVLFGGMKLIKLKK